MALAPLGHIPNKNEPEIWETPTLIHSGECAHYFIYHHTDQIDGMAHARCAHCHAGIMYHEPDEVVQEGKLITAGLNDL